MKITIEIPDEEIKDRLIDVIANQYYRDYSSDRRKVDMVTAECIRKIIYKDKERIVDLIANRASRHMSAGRERKNMLIVSQDRTWVANVENIVEITIEDRGVYSKDVNREMWELGIYESKKRCIEVLESICGNYAATSIFKMPEA